MSFFTPLTESDLRASQSLSLIDAAHFCCIRRTSTSVSTNEFWSLLNSGEESSALLKDGASTLITPFFSSCFTPLPKVGAWDPKETFPKEGAAVSAAFGAPKLKVGTPGFAAAMDGAGDLAFSISSATAAAVLSFCSLFLAKKDAGHFFTAGAGAPDCS